MKMRQNQNENTAENTALQDAHSDVILAKILDNFLNFTAT